MKLLGIFIIVNEHKQYTEYKRQKVSILDVIADISALFSTVFAFFLFGFQFYSKNYDNYKIIENFLSEKQSKIIKRTTQIELGDQINETNSKIEESIERGKSDPFILNDKNEIKEDDEKKDIKKETNLEKPSFRHFLFNNFYCDCLKFKKEHKIIELCNEIWDWRAERRLVCCMSSFQVPGMHEPGTSAVSRELYLRISGSRNVHFRFLECRWTDHPVML